MTGIKEKNGSWNGLIGMLLNDQIDVAVSEFIMDTQRSHVVDFSRPLVKTRFLPFTPLSKTIVETFSVATKYSSEIWVQIVTGMQFFVPSKQTFG